MKEFPIFEYIRELPPTTAQEEVGHTAWVFLHTLAKWVSNDPATQARAFELLKWIVRTQPCGACVTDGLNYIEQHPFNGNFKEYISNFHNHVNTKQKKEFIPPTKSFQPYFIKQKSPMQEYVFEVMISMK
jgi:hypothetical protein